MGENIEKLEFVFEAGGVVYIKHESLLEPVLCLIEKTDDQYIYFKMQEIFMEKNILIGDCVYCQVLKDTYEYVVYGEITDIDINPPKLIKVAIDKFNKYKNNRIFLRYNVNFQTNICLTNSNTESYAILKNISMLGAAIVTKDIFEKDTTVYVKALTFVSENDMLEFKGKIVRIIPNNNYFEYGIQILEIDLKNQDILEKVIFCLNLNEEVFIEELKKV